MIKDYLDQNKKGRTFLVVKLLILVILFALVMRYFDSYLINDISKNGIVSFELAKELSKSEAIIDSWDTTAKYAAGMSMGFDFLFLIIYSSFIGLLIYNINQKLWKSRSFYLIGKLMIWSIYFAALFDVIENIALIKLLLGDLYQVWSSIAYYFAMIKFIIIFSCIFYIISNGFIMLIQKVKK